MTDDQWQMKDVGLAESFLAAICHLSSIFHLSFDGKRRKVERYDRTKPFGYSLRVIENRGPS